jgi:hypothetical protein
MMEIVPIGSDFRPCLSPFSFDTVDVVNPTPGPNDGILPRQIALDPPSFPGLMRHDPGGSHNPAFELRGEGAPPCRLERSGVSINKISGVFGEMS